MLPTLAINEWNKKGVSLLHMFPYTSNLLVIHIKNPASEVIGPVAFQIYVKALFVIIGNRRDRVVEWLVVLSLIGSVT